MSSWRISIDTGGTFTDCIAHAPCGFIYTNKVLSSGRMKVKVKAFSRGKIEIDQCIGYPDGSFENSRLLLNGCCIGNVTRIEDPFVHFSPIEDKVDLHAGTILEIDSGEPAPVLALRKWIAKNSEEKVELRIGTTKATNSMLEEKFAPALLVLSEGFGDLHLIGDQTRPELFRLNTPEENPLYAEVVEAPSDLRKESIEEIRKTFTASKESGIEVVAVCLKNGYKSSGCETAIEKLLAEVGFKNIVTSKAFPFIHYLRRSQSVLTDAVLSPILFDYLEDISACLSAPSLRIMTSNGGLVDRKDFRPVQSLLSGPAGGVAGAVTTGRQAGFKKILTFDMGGTSTDVSRWAGQYTLSSTTKVGRASVYSPCLSIETIAAGGGSICDFDGHVLTVGPESAGSEPGPAAYGRGGPLTLTDLHLISGRIDSDTFIIPLSIERSLGRLDELKRKSGILDTDELIDGLLSIANQKMAMALRKCTVESGENPGDYALIAFGGAGGLHACQVAQELGIENIMWPSKAGLLSAVGIHKAPLEVVLEKQILRSLAEGVDLLSPTFKQLQEQATIRLEGEGVGADKIEFSNSIFLRQHGQESTIEIPWAESCDLKTAFHETYQAKFGYRISELNLEITLVRIVASEIKEKLLCEEFPQEMAFDESQILCKDNHRYIARESLHQGSFLQGPCVISGDYETFYLEEGWRAAPGSNGDILISRDILQHEVVIDKRLPFAVEAALVQNRLEVLVSEMGEQLKRTAISTNIRDRLDYSCAILDDQGKLLVNAPHIPVHLGALGYCLRECLKDHSFGPGDVLVTNHPAFGGSHLPDITMMSGLFDDSGELTAYIANRAHHAELGGKLPGSMPPDATSLMEEGVIIPPVWMIRSGENHIDHLRDLLSSGPYPSRNPDENVADLRAQLASLERGRNDFSELLKCGITSRLHSHFKAILKSGSDALSELASSYKGMNTASQHHMDDGTALELRIRCDEGIWCIDFTGTEALHVGNLNATPSIVRSVILYVFRLLSDRNISLNEGLLDKVDIVLPTCFLNPEFGSDPSGWPAVVGGNVETSQFLVEALLSHFQIIAGSQGTMNNLLFGNEQFGFYETIGGGSGAGSVFSGTSAKHVHMTNTAITDCEIMEHRYPVVCNELSIRKGSGGAGKFKGGDGIVRSLTFTKDVDLSLISENRKRNPIGKAGGSGGKSGLQYKIGKNGSLKALPGRYSLRLHKGEGIRIETPGGGGWGIPLQ